MINYLLIGNGVAGTTAAEWIRLGDQAGAITMVTAEDLPFYYRIRLPEFVAGEVTEERLLAKKPEWYREQRITLLTACRVRTIDPQQKAVTIATGQTLPYDRLLLATGSHSFVPPIPGADLHGVFTLRDIADARAMRVHAASAQRVVVIGGGLLGLETGQALRKLGKEVVVVEFFPRLLPRQLDDAGASRLQEIMEQELGFSFRLAARTREIVGEGRVTGVALEGGETLACDMVIISAGVRPNLELAAATGLLHDKGIWVNERMETSMPDIFAAGDVAEFGGQPPAGIWPAAMQQGKVAGQAMAGGMATYGGTTMANKLKVAGIDLAAAGDIDADHVHEARITATATTYRKIVIAQNRIIGCILLGDTADYGRLTKAITAKTELHLLDPGLGAVIK
jgi:nitrite reductase (NADH) large subunit